MAMAAAPSSYIRDIDISSEINIMLISRHGQGTSIHHGTVIIAQIPDIKSLQIQDSHLGHPENTPSNSNT